MSTPPIQPLKRSRRSSRRSKNTSAGVSDSDQPVTDSAPSPPDTGRGGAATPNTKCHVVEDPNQHRKPHGPKKTHSLPKVDRAPNHRNASPQPNLALSSQRQGTPIKQAYAGPTFHSSPAPSALPMPSFYSKSLPSIPPTKTPDIAEESQGPVVEEAKGENPPMSPPHDAGKRESTPLDFLFEAARQARDTPRAESPASRSANLSALEDSPISRSPSRREGGDAVFPFELDGNGSNHYSIGPAFATPYKERITALRSSSASPSMPSPTIDEEERKTKTEALKQLLMNAQTTPHPTAQAAPYTSDATNPFNARAPKFQSPIPRFHSTRHHSGPSTPAPPFTSSGPYQYFPDQLPITHGPRTTGSPVHRPPSSHLRRQYQVHDHESPVELSSDNKGTMPPSSARNAIEHPQSPYHSNNASNTALPRTGQEPNHKSPRSAQQLEDDLRRVLKLDLISRG
jgi:hypothetical protein